MTCCTWQKTWLLAALEFYVVQIPWWERSWFLLSWLQMFKSWKRYIDSAKRYPLGSNWLWPGSCGSMSALLLIDVQYSCLENPMDGGACWAAVHGVVKNWTWLSDFTFTFHSHALEKPITLLFHLLPYSPLPSGSLQPLIYCPCSECLI